MLISRLVFAAGWLAQVVVAEDGINQWEFVNVKTQTLERNGEGSYGSQASSSTSSSSLLVQTGHTYTYEDNVVVWESRPWGDKTTTFPGGSAAFTAAADESIAVVYLSLDSEPRIRFSGLIEADVRVDGLSGISDLIAVSLMSGGQGLLALVAPYNDDDEVIASNSVELWRIGSDGVPIWRRDFYEEGWKTLKRLSAYDSATDSVYIGGTDADGARRVARMDNLLTTPTVKWTRSLSVEDGTPQLILRQKILSAGFAPASEVLCISNAFYARIDAGTGEELELTLDNDWLATPPAVAYDPIADSLVEVGGSTLRTREVVGAAAISDLDLSSELNAANTADSLEDYPPSCSDDDEVCDYDRDDRDRVSRACAGYPAEDCDDDNICCASGSDECCVEDDFFENWFRSSTDPSVMSVVVTAFPYGLHVQGYYSGGVNDEDSWRDFFVATYAARTPPQNCDDSLCTDSSSWLKNGDDSKGCAWVAEKPGTRCAAKDSSAIFAFERCTSACGNCGVACVDSTTWHKKGDISKDCDWVSRLSNRRLVIGEDDTSAWESCRLASLSCQILGAGLDTRPPF